MHIPVRLDEEGHGGGSFKTYIPGDNVGVVEAEFEEGAEEED